MTSSTDNESIIMCKLIAFCQPLIKDYDDDDDSSISSNRSRGLTANTMGLMVWVHRTVVRCVICDVLQYVLVLDYGIRCSKKKKSYTLKLKLEAGEPDGSNRSRVSNRSRGFDGIVLIQAGGFY